ncbi:MAG: RsmD family RNA methyltransferase [Chitinophagaceae bacterium]
MRIIAGELGGRRINPPANMPYTRPTTDIAKEGLFNIIQNNLDLSAVKSLDLFGGTGSISFELASRGVEDITIIEKDTAMFEFIKKAMVSFDLPFIKAMRMDVFKYMDTCKERFDFIFAGPPYALVTIDSIPEIIHTKGLLKENGWFVLEHTPRNDYKKFPLYVTERNYGKTIFSIFVNKPVA